MSYLTNAALEEVILSALYPERRETQFALAKCAEETAERVSLRCEDLETRGLIIRCYETRAVLKEGVKSVQHWALTGRGRLAVEYINSAVSSPVGTKGDPKQ